MTVGVQIVGWIGLIGALVLTVAILREVELVLRTLRDIHRLAIYTRRAAEGVSQNVSTLPDLANVAGPAGEIQEGARRLAQTAAAIDQKLAER